jgi:hypothetical protein
MMILVAEWILSTVQHIGNMSFIHDSNGNNATIQRIGDMDFFILPMGEAAALCILEADTGTGR